MNKDVLVTVGGVLALSSLLFGAGLFVAGTALQSSTPAQPVPEVAEAKKDDEHGGHGDAKGEKKEDAHGTEKTADARGDKGGHGDVHGKKDAHGKGKKEEKEPEDEAPDEEYTQVLEKKFNDLYARGLYDDARLLALKAQNVLPTSLEWVRRLADSTFMADELAAQQRYQRAYELYSRMIVENPGPRESEWPRFRAVQCLKNLHRWEEASQASDTYLASYKSTPHAYDVALMQAQCQYALGDRDASRKTIEKLMALEIPQEVRAAAMLELAHIEREALPAAASEKDPRAEVVTISDNIKKPKIEEEPEPAKEPKLELSQLVPTAQWESIRSAAKTGNFGEAQRLIGPWLDANGPLNANQRARIALDYASLLKDLANAGN